MKKILLFLLSHKCIDQETAVDTDRECFSPHIH